MIFQYILYYGLVACWALNIYFLASFALRWHREEPSKLKAWLCLAVLAALAAGLAAALPARGGYDNDHDFRCLGMEFFSSLPKMLMSFKEVSPLFTDSVSDFLSGNSLTALLWKNRLLPALSLFVFFTGLRRARLSLISAAAASAFLFLNFLSPLNASTFSTTSSNVFIWLTSILALIDAGAGPAAGPAALAWIMSSLVLVISARIEFLPANLILMAALAAWKLFKRDRAPLRPASAAVLALGLLLAGAWTAQEFTPSPARQLDARKRPVSNMVYQLGNRNLAVIAGIRPMRASPDKNVDSAPKPVSIALCLAFMLFALAGAAAGRENRRERAAVLAALLLWAAYFSFIFQPMDFYPLHFMRHQLYFFVPFAFLFALALDGFESAAAGRRRAFALLCLAGTGVYAALNARAALAFNGELRTNDRELQFLTEAQRGWPARALALLPARNRSNTRTDVLRKYFPYIPDCGRDAGMETLKYVSAEHQVLSDSEASPLEQAPLEAGPAGSGWKTVTFPHAYYTAFAGRITETVAPVPVTIGFFPMRDARDKAYLETLDGLCAFDGGDYRKAEARFASAVKTDPSCLNCKYFLAVCRAGVGGKAAALAELAGIEKLSGKKLPPRYRALVETLAGGDAEGAAAMAGQLDGEDPDIFFNRDFAHGIREMRMAGQ